MRQLLRRATIKNSLCGILALRRIVVDELRASHAVDPNR